MITHILLWNYTPDATAAERAEVEALLVDLPTLIPSVRRLVFGAVFRWRVREYSHACTMVFDDVAGLDLYMEHAAHKAFVEKFRPVTTERAVIDFES